MSNGNLVVIDGVDGCGKGTQLELLKEEFPHVHFTREPGGTPFAEGIRKLLLSDRVEHVPALTDFLLFWAAREVHIQNVIGPQISSGVNVISDRFDSATYAFQLFGEEHLDILEGLFRVMRDHVLEDYSPDMYIILDLAPEVSLQRIAQDAKRNQTHFDLRPIEYHRRVREGFKCFAQIAPCTFIDANRSVEEVYVDVRNAYFSA